MIKKSIKYCLFACLLALSCNTASGDDDDRFIQIDFGANYSISAEKKFSFSVSGTPIFETGQICKAVTWDGSIGRNDYYGFAVEKEGFSLILYFPKQGSVSGTTRTLRPAPANTAPGTGEYTAVMRYKDASGDKVYKNPTGDIDLVINPLPNGCTEITMTNQITFTSPASITLEQTPSDPMVLTPY